MRVKDHHERSLRVKFMLKVNREHIKKKRRIKKQKAAEKWAADIHSGD